MAQGFGLSQTQKQQMQIVLAPQMRQSLHMLQVPIQELQTLIEQEMEQNPTLEENIEAKENIEIEPSAEDRQEDEFTEQFEALAQLDEEWRDYFKSMHTSPSSAAEEQERRNHFFDSLSQPESLQEHLLAQLALTDLSEKHKQIGEEIIGNINDEGYLASSIEEIELITGYPKDRLQAILSIIQDFDPIGVGARHLGECLLLQLHRLGKRGSIEEELIKNHLGELGAKLYADLAKTLDCPVEEIQHAAQFIATLEPRPGRAFGPDQTRYVLPEVIVQKIDGEYVVTTNDDHIPHLYISQHYRQLMEKADTSEEARNYIRDKIRAGAFMIKSIAQRQQTIQRIAEEVVRVQHDFLEQGIARLRPLTMAQVADVVDLHETTVSRAIANKYMQTPRGIFEMKYFFTPGYKSNDGTAISNKAIQEEIAQMIRNESPKKPLSDQIIANALKEKGFNVARRTVAKYREAMDIPPSHERKVR